MNLREWCENYLTERGLWPDMVQKVVEEVIQDAPNRALDPYWGRESSVVPDPILSLTLDRLALKLIDQECPKAWFRPLFDK